MPAHSFAIWIAPRQLTAWHAAALLDSAACFGRSLPEPRAKATRFYFSFPKQLSQDLTISTIGLNLFQELHLTPIALLS